MDIIEKDRRSITCIRKLQCSAVWQLTRPSRIGRFYNLRGLVRWPIKYSHVEDTAFVVYFHSARLIEDQIVRSLKTDWHEKRFNDRPLCDLSVCQWMLASGYPGFSSAQQMTPILDKAPEVITYFQNRWSDKNRIGDHLVPEWVITMGRNTH